MTRPGPVTGDGADEREFVSPGRSAPETFAEPDRDVPSHTDVVARDFSTAVGGPVGRHALVGFQRFYTPLRVLLLVALIFLSLGWFTKAGCLQQRNADGVLSLDWQNNRAYASLCYSDTVPLYHAERLDEGVMPYVNHFYDKGPTGKTQERYMEYPVVTGMYQYGAMRVAKAWEALHTRFGIPGAIEVVLFFNVVAVGLALLWLLALWATTRLSAGARRPWDPMVMAASPLVIAQIFTNFDAIAIAAMAVGMLLWARRRPGWAGVAIGLGTAAKLYPAFLLIVLLVLCLRSGRLRPWSTATATALLAWLVVNLPVMIAAPRGWWEFFHRNSIRAVDIDSIYNVASSFTGGWVFGGTGPDGGASTLANILTLVFFLLIVAGVAYVGFTAPRRPRVAQLMFLLLAGFLLVNKVWSPQYSLWLVPLAVLAIPHTRILLAWMTLDALVWVPRMMYFLGVSNKGLPEQAFTATVLLRDLAVVGLCALVLRQIYRPEEDLVRTTFPSPYSSPLDDPHGGVLDGAPDARSQRAGSGARSGSSEALASG
ncbi:glycosyltransferase 87 family protein [Tsukamurella sp. 8F]|uniref:glycosyltransferase family 87 protein n=1 Tax=unclassified Tsukamurella TaxID=2633480 RepID=UPI0023B89B8B|nr:MULTISPECIES: glycosyltransferase 87 family protein [unclassified Tsukamurella]MDF0529449.1 glycosyltransferase 87 family protein [Tsukamurella sp. 8J]MDF0589358.1 glycosyltransferase 87 family protein [Tsukamurella sp. 8F]